MQVPDYKGNGAEEGTRTPTPLRVHGPEPCASANSATSASDLMRGGHGRLEGRDCAIYSTRREVSVKPECQGNVAQELVSSRWSWRF